MNVEFVNMDEVSKWAYDLIQGKHGDSIILVTLFCGDRATCCDEAAVIKNCGRIVAVATIAPRGEDCSGKPAIVGVYVLPGFRKQGHASKVVEEAFGRCVERALRVPVRMDLMSSGIQAVVKGLPDYVKRHLEVHDQGNVLDTISC